MTTRGIITQLSGNTCTVRVPLFENPGSTLPALIENAVILSAPGVYGGYQVGDIIELTFEEDSLLKPLVLGKLFLGATTEATKAGGALKCDSLIASQSAVIPYTTALTGNYFATIKDMTDVIRDLQQRVSLLEDEVKKLKEK